MSQTKVEGAPRYFIQSVEKGLRLLQCFSQERPAMTLTELSHALQIPKAGTQRLVRTLLDLDYLQPLPGKRYALGVMALDLGHRYLTTLNLPAVAEPFLQNLVQKTQQTVNLAIRKGHEVVYVARIAAAPRIVSINLEVGSRLPLHATALGKALLLDFSDEQLPLILGEPPWEGFTPATKTIPEALRDSLLQGIRDGVVLNDGELEAGLRSIAAPVRNLRGEIVAAINVSTQAYRVPIDTLMGPLREALIEAAQNLSRALGQSHPTP